MKTYLLNILLLFITLLVSAQDQTVKGTLLIDPNPWQRATPSAIRLPLSKPIKLP